MKEAPRSIRVVAPASLKEGFTFDATIDGKTFEVKVPAGGVEQGEEFEVPYPRTFDESDEEDEVPTKKGKILGERDGFGVPRKRWRTSLFSCCDVVMQATFWQALVCQPVLIAQILMRLKLTWKAEEGGPEEAAMTFNRIVISFLIALALGFIPLITPVVLIVFAMLFVFIGSRLRNYMRLKYDISSGPCGCMGGHCGDLCCMICCGCCASIQMARHTHDDKEYPGYCCTVDGLPIDAPSIV